MAVFFINVSVLVATLSVMQICLCVFRKYVLPFPSLSSLTISPSIYGVIPLISCFSICEEEIQAFVVPDAQPQNEVTSSIEAKETRESSMFL